MADYFNYPRPQSSSTSTPISDPLLLFARPMPPAPAPLVYINGWPGVGKLAVAQCLALLLGSDRACLVDLRGRKAEGKKGSSEYRYEPEPTLDEPPSGDELTRLLSDPDHARCLFIMTDCAPDTPSGRTTAAAYSAAASRAGRMFVPVCLDCQPAEHRRRMDSLERRCSRRRRRTTDLDFFEGSGDHRLAFQSCPRRHGERGQKRGLTLDVTHLDALQTALRVLEHVHDEEARLEEEWSAGSSLTTPLEDGQEWKLLSG